MKRFFNIYLALIASSVLLAGCGAHCDCPKCPPTTVVAPESPAIVTPPDYDR